MNRFRPLFFTLLAAWISVSPSNAQEKIELRLGGVVGDRHQITVQMEERKTVVYDGEKTNSHLQMRLTATMELLEASADGSRRVRAAYTQLAVSSNEDGVKTHFNSTRDVKSKMSEAIFFNSLIGQSFVIKTDNRGKILKLEGLDALKEKLLKALKLTKKEKTEVQAVFDSYFPKVGQENSLGFSHLPDRAIAVGDSWERSFSSQEDYALLVKQTCTLKSNQTNSAVIEYRDVITPDYKNIKTITVDDVKLRDIVSGQGKGTLLLDKSEGQLISSVYEQRLTGKT